jgi:hypothetical protein
MWLFIYIYLRIYVQKMAFTMQTSTDKVGICINLLHDYKTRDKLQETNLVLAYVLAATNDTT